MLIQSLIAPLHPTARKAFVDLIHITPKACTLSSARRATGDNCRCGKPAHAHDLDFQLHPPDAPAQLCLLLCLLRAWWTQGLSPVWTSSVVAVCRNLVARLRGDGAAAWKSHLADAAAERLNRVLEQWRNSGSSRRRAVVLYELDQLYFKLYYYEGICARHFRKKKKKKGVKQSHLARLKPVVYLGVGRTETCRRSEEAAERFVKGSIPDADLRDETLAFLREACDVKANALLRIWGFHFCESVAVWDKARSRRPQDVEFWWENTRDWLCHLYAYAVPCEAALQRIYTAAESASEGGRIHIIEEGAGLGYWAFCLSSRFGDKVCVDALDCAPTTEMNSVMKNSYHGQVPPFYPVQQSSSGGESKSTEKSLLLLCYPPPQSRMAVDKLDAFNGRFVAYIGEFLGLTATPAFEQRLAHSFDLIDTVALPQTGSTANCLTIWRRKDHERKPLDRKMIPPIHPVFECMNPGCPARLGRADIFRCKLTRAVWCCSAACSKALVVRWRSELALRNVSLPETASLFDSCSKLQWPSVPLPELVSQKQRGKAPTNRRMHETTAAPRVLRDLPSDAGYGGRLPSLATGVVTCVLSYRSKKSALYMERWAVEEETARWRKCWRLRTKLKKLCKAEGIAVPIMAFERWLTSALVDKSVRSSSIKHDPLLPEKAYEGVCLVDDLTRANIEPSRARMIAKKLAVVAGTSLKDLNVEDPLAVAVEEHKHSMSYSLRWSSGKKEKGDGLLLKVNRSHRKKLLELFEAGDAAKDAFDRCVFLMLARYQAFSGHGFQAAANQETFKVLTEHLDVGCECFASPLNCNYGQYFSAFPDVDAPFGSLGSFFDVPTDAGVEGSYQANPPFIREVMTRMAERMEEMLRHAEGREKALSFAVFVPGWTDEPAWKLLEASAFKRGRVVIAKDEHGFCDGAQHQRKPRERYRESPFDTAVFILQTSAGSKRWSCEKKFEQELRTAMAGAHPTKMAKKLRATKGRSSSDKDGGGGVYKGPNKRKNPNLGVEARKRKERKLAMRQAKDRRRRKAGQKEILLT